MLNSRAKKPAGAGIASSPGLQSQQSFPLLKFPSVVSQYIGVAEFTNLHWSGSQWQWITGKWCCQINDVAETTGCSCRMDVYNAVQHEVTYHQRGAFEKGLMQGLAALDFNVRDGGAVVGAVWYEQLA